MLDGQEGAVFSEVHLSNLYHEPNTKNTFIFRNTITFINRCTGKYLLYYISSINRTTMSPDQSRDKTCISFGFGRPVVILIGAQKPGFLQ